ncbi:hypothetical protein QR680_009314 [Steinernema hermaphroditum]|uniref:Rab3-GAP regulatory subunit N-terminal domain-containing protein n=1 Tax=Steinernema hermaphroditum TaxID=289476 RepID=A0AA39ILM8_9BILA|nr:hypothetical protein QR680_009314 [Steinernema hermaphroditum]
MWCELNLHAKLGEAHIGRLESFFASERESPKEESAGNDDGKVAENRPDSEEAAGVVRWNDLEVDQTTESSSSSSLLRKAADAELRWINACLIASSSNVDVLVLALVQKFVVFERLPDGRMELSAQVEVDHNMDGYIASICILPVASPGNRKSDTSVYDWTCIAVGLDSGFVNFYSERGALLFSERVSHHPAKSLRFGKSNKAGGQELAILTENQIVVFEGLSLYNTLRNARAKIARDEETVEAICSSLEVKCHRYDINPGKSFVDDILVTGPTKPSSVDQYVAASLSETGYNTKLSRTVLPTYSTYFCIGEAPFGRFVWFDESGSNQNIVSDTIYNITNQVTSAVTSQLPVGIRTFLGIGTSRKDRPPKKFPLEVRSVSIPSRSELNDAGRCGERVYAAPNAWNLVAVADGSARVLLINTKLRQIVRIWKGYREARCAWIESSGKVASGGKGKALFLVIFAPRRGLLEVWAMHNGPRVSAFNVDRNGRLLWVGSTSQLLLGRSDKKVDTSTSAVFISSNGYVHQIAAPFHLALSGSSTASIHDENLLREICSERLFDKGKWKRFLDKMKTVSVRRRAAEFLVEMSEVDVSVKGKLLGLIREDITKKQSKEKGVSAEAAAFLHYLNSVLQLMDVYTIVDSFASYKGPLHIEEQQEELISKRLRMTLSDLNDMVDSMNRYFPHTEPPEELEMKPCFDFVAFLREFNFDLLVSPSPNSEGGEANQVGLWIPQKLKGEASLALGNFLFSPVLSGFCSISEFFQHIVPSLGIAKTALINTFCVFWLQKTSRSIFYLPHVLSFVERLIDFAVDGKTAEEAATVIIRSHIEKSCKILPALFLSVVVRAAILNRKDPANGNCGEVEEAVEAVDRWEPMEIGLHEWDLIMNHLRCLAVVASLPKGGEHSLENIRARGFGYYREQIGTWAASYMVDPEDLYTILSRPMTFDDHCDIDDFRPPLEKEMSDALAAGTPVEPWKFAIYDLRKYFPVSLMWYLVMCDCAWECFTSWHRIPGTKPVKLLKNAVCYVKFLDSWPHLQHGIALIAWDTFLRQAFQELYDLLNERGVQPPDYLVRRDVGVSETELIDFVEVVREVLQLLCVSVVDLDQIPLPKQEYEDFLLFFVEFDKTKASKTARYKQKSSPVYSTCLSELVCRKKSVNYHLVLHHIHLALVLQLQLSSHARLKPSSLFCDIGKRAFFESFHRHTLIPLDAVDDVLKVNRQKFALRIVKHMTETYASNEGTNKRLWSVLLDLAREWRLDFDMLRRREIELLFKEGLDRKAHENISSVVNRAELGSDLFVITVSRLKAFHDQSNADLLKEFQRYLLGTPRTIELIEKTPEKFVTHHQIIWKELNELANVTYELLQAGDPKNPEVRKLQKTTLELIKMIEHAKRYAQ